MKSSSLFFPAQKNLMSACAWWLPGGGWSRSG